MISLIFVVVLSTIVSCNAGSFKKMEESLHKLRSDFIIQDRAPVDEIHEVVFAIQQKNLDKLETLFYEVRKIEFFFLHLAIIRIIFLPGF